MPYALLIFYPNFSILANNFSDLSGYYFTELVKVSGARLPSKGGQGTRAGNTGGRGGTRTLMELPPQHFKCCACTNFATRPIQYIVNLRSRWELHPRIAVLQTAALAASPRDRKIIVSEAKSSVNKKVKFTFLRF